MNPSPRALNLSQQQATTLLNAPSWRHSTEVTFLERGRPTLFPGSWMRIPIRIAQASGLSFEQLRFFVTDFGGHVSSVPDSTFDPLNPHIVLLAGARAGNYKVVAFALVTGKPLRVVGTLDFSVEVRQSAQTKDGPSVWIEGDVPSLLTGNGAWGEPGKAGNAVQVYPEVKPAIGTRRVLVLLVDTASNRFSAAEAQASLTSLRAAMLDGAPDVFQDNATRSVRAFYEEMSYYAAGANPPKGLTIEARVDGPVSLPGEWDTYFPVSYAKEAAQDPFDSTKKVTRLFFATAIHYQPIVQALTERNKTLPPDQQIDLLQFDILCCIIRSVRPTKSGENFKSFWPHRQFVSVKVPAPTAEDPGATIDQNVNPFNMPDDWPNIVARTFQDTMSHEFGHSIGLGDLYTPASFDVGPNDPDKGPFRNLADWDTMAHEDRNPHFSLVSRLKLGWVKPDWLKRLNFLADPAAVDQTITISPVEKGAPPSGTFIGAEIRVGANWNYYVEYRSRQAGQIGDNWLPVDDRVVCTDALAQGYQASSLRPEVILLWNDKTVQSDGPVLGAGQSYLEQDPNGNGKQLKISVLSIKNGLATVRIQYKVFGVDLGIRPWPAGPDRPWQSPDIEIRNEKSKKDPAYFNTAWTNNVNDVIARITNSGNADAPGVAVNISIKNFNVGDKTTPVVQQLAKVVKDVPAGQTVEFPTQWTPLNDGHYCVYVEIVTYANAGPPLLVDMNPTNNIAQSNYSTTNLNMSSPAERVITTVSVGNPHNVAAVAYLVPTQTNPFYRTYLSNRWISLKPKEVREVTCMMESRLDWNEQEKEINAYMSSAELRSMIRKTKAPSSGATPFQQNRISIAAYMPDPTTVHPHNTRLLGGVQLQARTGRGVKIVDFSASSGGTAGRVVTTSATAEPVKTGHVILTYSNRSKRAYVTLPVVNGAFHTPVNVQGSTPERIFAAVQAYYSPNGLYGEAFSKVIQLGNG